jgi:hypothetical protein
LLNDSENKKVCSANLNKSQSDRKDYDCKSSNKFRPEFLLFLSTSPVIQQATRCRQFFTFTLSPSSF